MATEEAKITLNVLKNANITINCRARIKSKEEQDLVDAVETAVKETDTHIGRIRFDRNPKSYGSSGTRFVKQSYYPKENVYELYVNLAKVTNRRTGAFQLTDVQKFIDNIKIHCDRKTNNNQKFINKVNRKYKLEES